MCYKILVENAIISWLCTIKILVENTRCVLVENTRIYALFFYNRYIVSGQVMPDLVPWLMKKTGFDSSLTAFSQVNNLP